MYRFALLLSCFANIFIISAFSQNMGMIEYTFKDGGEIKKMELYFDSFQSKCVYNKIGFETGYNEQLKQTSSGFTISIKQYDSIGIIIYRNFFEKNLLIRYPKVSGLSPFLVTDNWVDMKWKLSKRKKNILGYKCFKASTDFRGRKYVVWYTTSIPLPYGPWKFCGLPGIILLAYDTDKLFEWKAIQLSLESNTPISPPYEAEHKDLKQFVYYLDNQLEFVYERIKKKSDSLNINKPSNKQIIVGDFQRFTSVGWERKKRLEVKYEFEKNIPFQIEDYLKKQKNSSDSTYYFNFERK